MIVFAFVLDIRQFLGTAVLAPSLGETVVIDDERSVGAAGTHSVFLDGAMADPFLSALGVIPNSPTSSENAVVAFDQLGERIPGRGVEFANYVCHRVQPSLGSEPGTGARFGDSIELRFSDWITPDIEPMRIGNGVLHLVPASGGRHRDIAVFRD